MKIPFKRIFTLLSTYLKPQIFQASLLGLLLTSTIGLQLINPQILRYFVDAVVEGEAMQRLIFAALLFIGIALMLQGTNILTTYVSQKVSWTATNRLRKDLVMHSLELDLSFHKKWQSGELIERIDGDVLALSNFFSRLIIDVITNLALLLGIVILMFREDWRVGLVMLFFVIFATYILSYIQRKAVPHWMASHEVRAKFYGLLGEQITNLEDIRSNGAVAFILNKLNDYLRGWYLIRRKAGMMGYAMWMTTVFVFALGTAFTLGVSGYLWSKGVLTIGTIVMIFHYIELMYGPIEKIRTELEDLQKASASIKRIEELLEMKSELKAGTGPNLTKKSFEIDVTDLSFYYEEGFSVLEKISFKLTPKRVLGILGRTGSGKTTLARLLARLYDPTSGVILFDGKELDSIPEKSLRQRISYVTQDVQLFHGTIRDNLTFFDPDIEDQRVIQIFEELGLKDWYNSLKDGLDTRLDAGGEGFSAGEAQLLAFVRVFLRDPGLIILDEASSRLDPVTEQLIEQAIDKLLAGRSSIIIAHRLETMRRADDILILEAGKVSEYGSRKELLTDYNSKFSQLLRSGIEEVLG